LLPISYADLEDSNRQGGKVQTGFYSRLISHAFPTESLTRDIVLICLSNVIGAFGEGLYFWFFPLYVQSLGANYFELGLVISTLFGFSAMVPLFGGLLADRFERKTILILSWTPWVLAPLIYSFASNWIQLIPGTFCWGLSMVGLPAVTAYVITCLSDKTKIASVLALVWGSYSFSYIFAPGIGGYLATIIGMQWVLRIATNLSAVATGVFFFLRPQHPKEKEKDREKAQPVEGGKNGMLQRFAKNLYEPRDRSTWRRILIWSMFLALSSFFIGIGRSFVQTFLKEQISMSDVQIGVFFSINYAGITFLGIAMGRISDKWRKSGAIGFCLLFYCASIIPLLLYQGTSTLMLFAFPLGGSAITAQLVYSYVGAVAPKSKRGVWVSIPQTASLLASFIAPLLGGYLYTFSPAYAFLVSISAMPILAAYAFRALKA
jgi:MFS family permease